MAEISDDEILGSGPARGVLDLGEMLFPGENIQGDNVAELIAKCHEMTDQARECGITEPTRIFLTATGHLVFQAMDAQMSDILRKLREAYLEAITIQKMGRLTTAGDFHFQFLGHPWKALAQWVQNQEGIFEPAIILGLMDL